MSDGRELATRLYAAINGRDRDAIRGLTAPDIVVATTVETFHGADALLGWMDDGDDAFDDFNIELLSVEELAGQVVVSNAPARPREDERRRGRPPVHSRLDRARRSGNTTEVLH